jgi:hypothetical protein
VFSSNIQIIHVTNNIRDTHEGNMKKTIMIITLILSLLAMAGITLALGHIGQLLSSLLFGGIGFDLSVIGELFATDILTALSAIGVLLWGLAQIYGIPIIIFLVSLQGLTSK